MNTQYPQTVTAKSIEEGIQYLWALAHRPQNIQFAKRFKFENPRQLFYLLKRLTRYRLDPHKKEVFQQIQTLFGKNNIHGRKGYGDCDCFTSAIVSIAAANNLPAEIVVQGNNKGRYTHVYPKIFWRGTWWIMDLTNKIFNYARDYKFSRTFSAKDMNITLADDEEQLGAGRFRRLIRKGITYTPAYQVGRMALNYTPQGRYLQRFGRRFRFRLGDDGQPDAVIMNDGYTIPLARRGRGFGRALRQFGRWTAQNAGSIILPAAAIGANLIVPGSGTALGRFAGRLQNVVGRVQSNRLTPIATAALRNIQAGRGNIVTTAPLPVDVSQIESITPARGSEMPISAINSATPEQPRTNQLIKGVPNIALIGGAALGAYLLLKKK